MSELEQRREIIRFLLNKYSGSVSGYRNYQQELWVSSLEQLQRILNAHRVDVSEAQQRLADIQADRQRMAEERTLSNIFRTPVNVNGQVVVAIDNQASRNIIRSWFDESKGDTAISTDWFQKVLRKTPSLANQLSWQSADILDPVKRRQTQAAQDAEDHRVFHEFCRDNGFSEVQANFSLVKSVLGSFDQYTLAQAVQSNALQGLAPASSEELEQFRQEAIELHNQYLLNLDLPTLRELAREAGARGPAPSQPDETQRIRALERNDGFAYPTLPDEIRIGDREEVLDSAFIQRCSREIMQMLIKKYGSAQITEALNTRRPDASPLWQ